VPQTEVLECTALARLRLPLRDHEPREKLSVDFFCEEAAGVGGYMQQLSR
jgi:hypothetical protein